MKAKIIIFGLLLASILLAGIVFAQTELGVFENHPAVSDLKEKINEKENELKSLEKSANIYAAKIEEARAQSRSLQSQLLLIDNQITKTELDVKTMELAMDKAKLEIEATQYQVDLQQKEIDAQKNQLREYIKLIHKEDQKSLLEVLIVNESFSEFFNQINFIEGIQADLQTSIGRVQLLKDALEAKKAELISFQDKLAQAKKSLEDNQSRLREQLTAKEVVLFQTKHSEAKYTNLLQEAQDTQNEVDESISSIKDELRKKIERLKTGGSTDPKTTLLYWPVDPSRGITTYFNDPGYPYRHLFEHSALDIRAYQGSNILSPADGYVARARDNGYGYSYITVVHDNGLSTVFGHVSKILVKNDQFVKAGEVVGLSGGAPGSRGAGPFTTGPHLHFEVRLNGIPVDPMLYLP